MAATVARYDDYHAFRDGLRALRDSGCTRYEAYGPIDLESVEELMPRRGSMVRFYATVGALIGMASFFFMCTASALIYSLVTGGKPPLSNVPYVVVTYEGTILLGGVAAFLAVLALARLWPREPRWNGGQAPWARFVGDSFGIVVDCGPEQRCEVRDILKRSGASEVKEIE